MKRLLGILAIILLTPSVAAAQTGATSPIAGAPGYAPTVKKPGHWTLDSTGKNQLIKHNLAATSAPTSGDDTADGYSVGSLWLDTTSDLTYVCVDATASAAVWNACLSHSTGRFGLGSLSSFSKLKIPGATEQTESRFAARKATGLVTFCFDDGNDSVYTIAKPVFDGEGVPACVCPITSEVGTAGKMTWAQIRALEAAGWEVVNHSDTHPYFTGLTESQIRSQWATSNAAYAANGVTVPKNCAYPYGAHNETVRRITREYFRSARATIQTPNLATLETFALRCVVNDDHTLVADYKVHIDTAASSNLWIIFFMHSVTSDDASCLQTLIDYAQAKPISIVTIDQALELVGNAVDIHDDTALGPGGLRTPTVSATTGTIATLGATTLTATTGDFGSLTSESATIDPPAAVTNETVLKINSLNAGNGLGIYSIIPSSPAADRNWAFATNTSAYGDFTIRQSTSRGGHPITAGTDRLYIGYDGNVRVGGTSADTKLDVVVNGDAAARTSTTNTNGGTSSIAEHIVRNGETNVVDDSLRLMAMGTGYTTAGGFVQDSGVLNADTGLSGGLSIMTRAAAPIRFYTNGHTNERMQIGSDGTVTIRGPRTVGASIPAAPLHLPGRQIITSGNMAFYMDVVYNTYAEFATYNYGDGSTFPLCFQTNGGNFGIRTTTPGGSGTAGSAVLSIGNGTAPVGGVANQVSLYSADVTASAELFAMDEAGNTPQLTPHPADFLDTLPTKDRPYPWAYSCENRYLGKKIQVDLAGLAAAVEKLTGEQFVFVTDLPAEKRITWDSGQDAQAATRQSEIDAATAAKALLAEEVTTATAGLVNATKAVDDEKAKPQPDADVTAKLEADAKKAADALADVQKRHDAVKVPAPYTPRAPPKWMADRGVISKHAEK